MGIRIRSLQPTGLTRPGLIRKGKAYELRMVFMFLHSSVAIQVPTFYL